MTLPQIKTPNPSMPWNPLHTCPLLKWRLFWRDFHLNQIHSAHSLFVLRIHDDQVQTIFIHKFILNITTKGRDFSWFHQDPWLARDYKQTFNNKMHWNLWKVNIFWLGQMFILRGVHISGVLQVGLTKTIFLKVTDVINL